MKRLSYAYRNANTYTDADPMHWETCTNAEAARPDSAAAPVVVPTLPARP